MSEKTKQQKAIDRIKKLLALASNNPSQAEREAALAQAHRLMMEHRIEEDDLQDEVVFVVGEAFRITMPKGNKLTHLLVVIRKAAGVFALQINYGRARFGLQFTGRPDAIAFATYLFEWLSQEYDRQWLTFRAAEMKARRTVKLAKKDVFLRGIAHGLLIKLILAQGRFEKDHALVLAPEAEQAERFWEAQEGAGDLSSIKPKKYTNNKQAYFGGIDAAENINLNRPLEAPAGEQRRLLN